MLNNLRSRFPLISLIYLSEMIMLCSPQDNINKVENEISCREKNRKIASEKGDLYNLVEATIGEKLMLQCHYCNEIDDEQPKNWYKTDKLNNLTGSELQIDMMNNVSLSRIHVNNEHTLIFHNVTSNDSGIYYCYGLEEQESEYKYNYLIDIIYDINITYESGNLSHWKTYHEEQMMPINKLFKKSKGVEYDFLREILHLDVEAATTWDQWGPCETCGRPQGEGRRRKEGFCRLKIKPTKNTTNEIYKNDEELFVSNVHEISCKSIIFGKLCPGISNITKLIPNFMLTERCEGLCNPDAEGVYRGWKSTKKGFKYRKTFVLAEGSHLTIICPESTLENSVEWSRNGKRLEPGESVPPPKPDMEPKIIVDTFNTLYLHDVTTSEEGNYTCTVDGIRMQQVIVFVVSKSRLLTQAMVRHMIYLGFVLCMTLTCYCAGLVVTCTRRRKFKTYEELKLLHKGDEEDFL